MNCTHFIATGIEDKKKKYLKFIVFELCNFEFQSYRTNKWFNIHFGNIQNVC